MDKSELLSWLREEYQQWEAFLGSLDPARMDQPSVSGPWSIKDIVAHMTGWNRRLVTYIQAAQRGEPLPPSPWPAHLQTDDEINAWIYAANQARPLGEVLAESRQMFEQLFAVIASLPDDTPVEPERHLLLLNHLRFPAGEFFDHFHDDHERDMRAWLARAAQ